MTRRIGGTEDAAMDPPSGATTAYAERQAGAGGHPVEPGCSRKSSENELDQQQHATEISAAFTSNGNWRVTAEDAGANRTTLPAEVPIS